jgi:hypothetical protein
MLFTVLICIMAFLCLGASKPDGRGLVGRPKAPTGEVVNGRLWLLTIGIKSYIHWPKLKTAVNDARAIKSVLLDRYHLNEEQVIELTDENATRKGILSAFRKLAKNVRLEDSLLVFYAGHGHIDAITGKGSWIPVESGTEDPSNWISNRDITDYLNINAIKAKHVLLVSDSCFSGDFFRGSRGGTPLIDDAFLKKAYTRSSRQVVTSGGMEPVSDAGFGGNSVFSYFFIQALKNNTKNYLIPSDIFAEIKAGVGKNANQLPQFGDLYGVGGQDGGELILFIKESSRLQEVADISRSRQIELEHLKRAQVESEKLRLQEQSEIKKKEAELSKLDLQIAEMKSRLGTSAARKNDSLDAMIDMVIRKKNKLKS